MQWQCKKFLELDVPTLFTIMKARVDVFVVEQACPYPELDEVDRAFDTHHVYASVEGCIAAYARVYVQTPECIAIGRVLVSEPYRGKGIAATLMEKSIEVAINCGPYSEIKLSAQTYLLKFYAEQGFKSIGEPYLEDGIEHQDMILISERK
ncbi:GNAT family N-acetyltransferase [Pseudoalteromonas citrea]|uniref:GNAT family N-acetyltransferase n=1 Tax=Pseudoalteromonas citrea TaxID=43655 RepID=A0A5S3XWB2_9GAMM|nr:MULTISPECIES: GNAT family N-acetyltransferase [Pseudoalteromonas]RJE75958.1 GNAT family N-acetyltransferase [Pseudoalteromonas sp. MSK9-3]TMP43503.1 GNAT family N-acetyltransferase [Pseudoalteromonas citrea]TMP62265.1 GNAT family N-acetyltransferase [Pseudoalteromonas citrea]